MVEDGLHRAARAAGPDVAALVEGVSAWGLALQGQTPLRRDLLALTEAFGAEAGAPDPILSFGNPARLSRAEFRLCTLLAAGLSTKQVREELGISQSTLRSHLRQIHAKTGTATLADLLYRLLAPEGPVAAVTAPAPAGARKVS